MQSWSQVFQSRRDATHFWVPWAGVGEGGSQVSIGTTRSFVLVGLCGLLNPAASAVLLVNDCIHTRCETVTAGNCVQGGDTVTAGQLLSCSL